VIVRLIQESGPEHFRPWHFVDEAGERLWAGLFVDRVKGLSYAEARGWTVVELVALKAAGRSNA